LLTPSIFEFKENVTMPKIKTNRSAAKRFKKTGTGKIIFSKSNANHNFIEKNDQTEKVVEKKPLYR